MGSIEINIIHILRTLLERLWTICKWVSSFPTVVAIFAIVGVGGIFHLRAVLGSMTTPSTPQTYLQRPHTSPFHHNKQRFSKQNQVILISSATYHYYLWTTAFDYSSDQTMLSCSVQHLKIDHLSKLESKHTHKKRPCFFPIRLFRDRIWQCGLWPCRWSSSRRASYREHEEGVFCRNCLWFRVLFPFCAWTVHSVYSSSSSCQGLLGAWALFSWTVRGVPLCIASERVAAFGSPSPTSNNAFCCQSRIVDAEVYNTCLRRTRSKGFSLFTSPFIYWFGLTWTTAWVVHFWTTSFYR